MSIDDILARVRARLDLEAEAEQEILEEIRGHLEDAVDAARVRGLDERAALAQAAARFGVEEAAQELRATHTGWGTTEGVAAAALPTLFALVLRWSVFAPGASAVEWRTLVSGTTLWALALVALLVPFVLFQNRRYALFSWLIFWGLSTLTAVVPTLHW